MTEHEQQTLGYPEEQTPSPAIPGGDFVVTITSTVQLRIPDPAVVADALGLSPVDAMVEIADVLGIAGQHLDALDALPLGSFEIVRTARATADVDRIDRYTFTDGSEWTTHVPAVPDETPTSGYAEYPGRQTFVITDRPLSPVQSLAVRDVLRTAALSAEPLGGLA